MQQDRFGFKGDPTAEVWGVKCDPSEVFSEGRSQVRVNAECPPVETNSMNNVPAVTSEVAVVPATYTLSIDDGFIVKISEESGSVIRSVVNKAGSIRVSFVPVSSKSGTSLKSLGFKGQAAKAVLRRAKREIGSAIIGAMATAVSAGKLDWKAATVSKTGTYGIFFSEGAVADAAELAAAEEKTTALEAEIASLKAALAAK